MDAWRDVTRERMRHDRTPPVEGRLSKRAAARLDQFCVRRPRAFPPGGRAAPSAAAPGPDAVSLLSLLPLQRGRRLRRLFAGRGGGGVAQFGAAVPGRVLLLLNVLHLDHCIQTKSAARYKRVVPVLGLLIRSMRVHACADVSVDVSIDVNVYTHGSVCKDLSASACWIKRVCVDVSVYADVCVSTRACA